MEENETNPTEEDNGIELKPEEIGQQMPLKEKGYPNLKIIMFIFLLILAFLIVGIMGMITEYKYNNIANECNQKIAEMEKERGFAYQEPVVNPEIINQDIINQELLG